MIKFSLKCAQDHGFDSWFQSAEAFDALMSKGLVECPDCGSIQISKAMMAPKVQGTKRTAINLPADQKGGVVDPRETALAELRKQVKENSEYVGMNFAAEARAIHSGASPERSIYGEAKPAEAKSLIEDGVPVAPLPFAPKRKMN